MREREQGQEQEQGPGPELEQEQGTDQVPMRKPRKESKLPGATEDSSKKTKVPSSQAKPGRQAESAGPSKTKEAKRSNGRPEDGGPAYGRAGRELSDDSGDDGSGSGFFEEV